MKRRPGIAAGLLVAGALALATQLWGGSRTAAPTGQVGRVQPSPAPALLTSAHAPAVAGSAATSTMFIEAVDAAIAVSSLRGSSPDGDWGVDGSGRFHPSREVRRRFDYYLALQGEVPLDALQRWMRARVSEGHGAAAAAQVMQVFASYVRLQRYAWRTEADPQQPRTLGPALAERTQVRRELLGIEVAQAFYRDDDAALLALVAQANSGAAAADQTAPVDGIRQLGSATPLPDAAERLSQWQSQWDDWERRLTDARAELARVRTAPELSAPQREAAIDTWLAQRFDAAEQRRARALLRLPPT